MATELYNIRHNRPVHILCCKEIWTSPTWRSIALYRPKGWGAHEFFLCVCFLGLPHCPHPPILTVNAWLPAHGNWQGLMPVFHDLSTSSLGKMGHMKKGRNIYLMAEW